MPTDLPTRPLLIFDGDCSFCRRWIARWKRLTRDAIDYEPSQTAAERFPEIDRAALGKSVFLIEPDGRVTRAAEAVFRTLALAGQCRCLLWLYDRVVPFRWTTEQAYRFIAANRSRIDPIDKRLFGAPTPGTYAARRR